MATRPDDDRQLAHNLAELLDKVMVHGTAGVAVQQQLTTLMDECKEAGESRVNESLIHRAQGLVGMVNASQRDGPARARAYSELTEFKQTLRSIAAGREN